MTHSGIAALLVVVVGVALTGCAQDVGEVPPGPEATNRTTTSEAPSGTTKPPHSTLILGKHAVAGVHGSYCWESASGANEAVSRCADAAGIPVPPEDEALTVPRDWVVVFDYGGGDGQLRWTLAHTCSAGAASSATRPAASSSRRPRADRRWRRRSCGSAVWGIGRRSRSDCRKGSTS